MRCGRATRRRSTSASPFPAGYRGYARAVSSLYAELSRTRGRGDRPPGRRIPAHRPGRLQAADRRADSRRHRYALVFGLDHILSEQEAAPEEIAAIEEWLKREGTCLLLAPHHDVGFTDDFAQRQMEFHHHGDPLVPRQQRFGQYTRSLMKALDVPGPQHVGTATRGCRGHQGDRTPDRVP